MFQKQNIPLIRRFVILILIPIIWIHFYRSKMFIISKRLQLVLMFGVCLFSFLPGMYKPNNNFMLDDQVAVRHNMDVVNTSRPLFQSLGLIVQHDFWGQDLFNNKSHKSYRPLVTMFFHLEYRISRDLHKIASTMRANNLVLHYFVCVALRWVFARILPELHQSYSFCAVLLFTVHPIHTEVIYNIVGRADILCALIFLIAIYNYWEIMTVRRNLERKMIPMVLFGLMCMLSKEIGIILLPFCAVLDIIHALEYQAKSRLPGRRVGLLKLFTVRPDLVKRISYLAIITTVLAIIRFTAMNFAFPKFNKDESPIANDPSFFLRAFTYPYIHFIHFWLLICPDWLCFDWSHNSITPIESFSDPRIFLAIMLYLFLFITFVNGRRSVRIAVALIVIPFIPSSNLFSIGFVVADRVLYIPAMGYCLLVSIGYHYLHYNVRWKKLLMQMMIVTIAILMIKSNFRTYDYESEYDLYVSGLRVNPKNAKINYNIAKVCFDRADFQEAFAFGERANMLRPNHPPTLNNLANACRRINKHDLAIEYLAQAVEAQPDYSLGWMNLGVTYSVLNRYLEALDAYTIANDLQPNNEKILFNLAILYSSINNEAMAGNMYKQARDLNPTLFRTQKNYLMNRADYGTLEELIEACDNAEKNCNDDTQILLLIAEILSQKNYDFERVESILKRVIKIDPENVEANLRFSLEYKRRVNIRLALKHFKRALQLNPNVAKDVSYSDLMTLLEEERRFSVKPQP